VKGNDVASELQHKVIEALTPPPTTLDGDTIFWAQSPKAPVVYYVRFFGELACKINVQAAHDKNLLRQFMGELTAEQVTAPTPERPVLLAPSRALESTPFQQRVVVHPSVSQGAVSHTTMFMSQVTRITFPAYRCEFTNDDTRDEAAFRMAKVFSWSKWERPPGPALSARFHRLRSGVKSTGGKRMGIFPPKEVENTITHLAEDDGFIDIENYQRKLVRIEHADGRYEVIQDDQRWVAKAEGILPWFRVFAIDGADAASKARDKYVA
jgi:hypothetical protein